MADGRKEPDHLFDEAFVQHADHLAEIAVGTRVDPDLLRTLAIASVTPSLRAYADALQPLADGFTGWSSGFCPVCGAWPILGEPSPPLTENTLRCGACGSAWQHPQTCCYCGSAN